MSDALPQPAAAPHRSPPHLVTLVLFSATAVLTLNMFLPSLPSMARDFGARESVMALALSGYMVVSSLFQLIFGPLSDRFGRRPVMLASLALYALASLGCLLSQTIESFFAFRLLQSMVVAGSVIPNAVIRDRYTQREAAGKMGAIASAMALAPMLGPMVGGFMETWVGWRAIFALYTALGAAGVVLCWIDMGETRKPGQRPLRLADYGALLGTPSFWAYMLCHAFTLGAFFIFITGVPFIASALWDLSPALIGLAIGSMTIGFMVGSAITARLAPRLGTARLITAGRVIPTLAMLLALALFLGGAEHPLALFGLTVFIGLGNGLTVANAVSGAMSVRPELAGTAAGLNGAAAILFGALMTYATAVAAEWSATPLMLIALLLATILASLVAGLVAVRLDRGR